MSCTMQHEMFTRDDTKAIKGMAVIMMLFHHLVCFSDRYPVGFEGFSSAWKGFVEDGYLGSLAFNVRLCVAVFFFLGGYGMYKRREAGKFDLLDSILALFKKYWKVFVIFVPIAFIFFRRSGEGINILCTRYAMDNPKDIITAVLSNFVGLSDSLNSEWWFIQTYVCALMAGSLYCIATKKSRSLLVELFIVFTIDIFTRDVFPAIANTEMFSALNHDFYYNKFFKLSISASSFFAGVSFAKHDALVRLKKIVGELPFKRLIALFGCFAVLWCRSFVIGDLVEIIYVILFVTFLSVFFDGFKPLKTVFGFVGNHSTNIWLIHSFYCYYFLEVTEIVYSTRSVWADLLILVLLSLASSIILEFIFKAPSYIKTIIQKKTAAPKPAEP